MKRRICLGASFILIAVWAISLLFNAGVFVEYGPMPTSVSVGVRDANVVIFWGNSGNLYATAGEAHLSVSSHYLLIAAVAWIALIKLRLKQRS